MAINICQDSLQWLADAQVLCGWLEERMRAGEPAALFLPLLYLVRGRLAEALAAHARLAHSPVPGRLAGALDQLGSFTPMVTATSTLLQSQRLSCQALGVLLRTLQHRSLGLLRRGVAGS